MEERRSAKRAIVENIPVEIYAPDGIKLLGIGYIVSLGVNCAGLETIVDLKAGQMFFMRFILEKKYLINVWGQIIRSEVKGAKKYYGVRFSKIDLMPEDELKKFLEKKFTDV